MKQKVLLTLLVLPLVVGAGCTTVKGLVRDVCKVVEAAVDVPVNAATNVVESVKNVAK